MPQSKCGALPLGDIPKWGGRWDSNPRQPEPQSGALPTELRPPRFGASLGDRTLDTLIKSQVLYQLS